MAARLSTARIALGLFLASLLVRLAVLALTPFPAYPDAEYYTAVARELAAGHGFIVPYVWAFVDVGGQVPASAALPIPAFGHWMPLASIVQVPFIWLLGPTDLASALPFVLLAAALAPFTYLLTRDLLPDHPAPALAGLLAVVPAATGYLSQPDNYALYGLLGAGGLWLTARVLTGRAHRTWLWLGGAGLLCGLSFLARTDGFLLAGAIGLSVAAAWILARRQGHQPVAGLRYLVPAGMACLALVVPWELRNLGVFGTFSESAASGRVLFIRDFGEHFGAGGPLTIDHLLSWGAGPLFWSRVVALAEFVVMTAVGLLALVQVPPALAGAWSLRRRVELAPFAIWGVLFALWSILIVPAPFITTGNFMHAALVLLPITCACAALGVGQLVRAATTWRARSRPSADGHSAAGPSAADGRSSDVKRIRFWGRALVLLTAVAAFASTAGQANAWRNERALAADASGWLAAHAPADSRVMSADPGALYLAGGWSGIQTPTSPMAVIEQAAQAYQIRYLVVESASAPSALEPLVSGPSGPVAPLTALPVWLQGPLFTVPGSSPLGRPALAIYAVREPFARTPASPTVGGRPGRAAAT
jgi:4-amino-4-deoxy-L-arabinose transferase-like glycosyltransferase